MLSLSTNALTVLKKRYLKRNEKGDVVETPEEMFRRVARHIAGAERLYNSQVSVEEWEEKFYELMATLKFLPNSPTLMNAGRELGQLSACFVLPVEDTMESIFEAIKNTALIHKSGGGTGFSFSKIRPKNDVVKSTKGISSGPVSFMTVFDAATETIKQGGTRRGANMGILRVDHPDIMDFITCKTKTDKLNNFNISVAITDKFMKAVENDEEYELINPRNGAVSGKLRARDVFEKIIEQAWLNGEPGIIFIDRINEKNPTPHIGEIESTNPCGEQPLLPYESCNLGSINLSKFVVSNGNGAFINWDDLRETVRLAVRFLDNVIDVNKYPIPQIEKMTKGNRKIGLGVMGFADMLLELMIPYDTETAIEIGERVMKFIRDTGWETSEALAEEKGVFPNYKGSVFESMGRKMRNATVTTIAPTGSISLIAGCSSGIEPIFSVCYFKNVLDGEKLVEVNPVFKKFAMKEGFYSEKLIEKIAEKGTLKNIEEVPEKYKRVFVSAHEISPEWHIRMQAAFQKYTDNAVSKTVNFPREATKEDIKKVYLLAYKLGCKGVTVYRDGSRENQVVEFRKEEKKEQKEMKYVTPRERPLKVKGTTYRMVTGCGNLYVTVNYDELGLFECFAAMGKAGGCAASQAEAVSRMISLALRSGVEPESIVKQLKGVRCPAPGWTSEGVIYSCADAIARAIELALSEKDGFLKKSEETSPSQKSFPPSEKKALKGVDRIFGICPECGGTTEIGEGCFKCLFCGYSNCY
jgi:ribonucleoside-diphosphate reductase alpha chain